jgi:hypothetical protein
VHELAAAIPIHGLLKSVGAALSSDRLTGTQSYLVDVADMTASIEPSVPMLCGISTFRLFSAEFGRNETPTIATSLDGWC